MNFDENSFQNNLDAQPATLLSADLLARISGYLSPKKSLKLVSIDPCSKAKNLKVSFFDQDQNCWCHEGVDGESPEQLKRVHWTKLSGIYKILDPDLITTEIKLLASPAGGAIYADGIPGFQSQEATDSMLLIGRFRLPVSFHGNSILAPQKL